jgi:hypothetical protein
LLYTFFFVGSQLAGSTVVLLARLAVASTSAPGPSETCQLVSPNSAL